MKHKKANKTLGRVASDRVQLLKNLSSSLLEHGAIVTTTVKAKALQRFFEPLVTQGRKEATLHQRRLLRSRVAKAEDVNRLFELGKEMKRPGGYTRIVKLPGNRNDAAETARIEIVK